MNTANTLGFRSELRLQNLNRALIGVSCLRVFLLAGSGYFGTSLGAMAIQWISCAIALILLDLLGREVREQHPGISTVFCQVSYVALAGSLLPTAASLLFLMGLAPVPVLGMALGGLTLSLCSALLLEWFFTDVCWDGPLPNERMMIALLRSWQEIVERCV
jgi:hypothetical protein